MKVYQGKSVFNGVSIGRIAVYKREQQQIVRSKIEDIEKEIRRFQDAKEKAICQLEELHEKAIKEVGEANAAIFEIHQMMLNDEDYEESIENIIRTQEVNAEYAVGTTGDNFATMFAAMEDDYMRERSADVRDISERVLAILNGTKKDNTITDEPVILVADDLAPSETVQLNKEKILSFVTIHGSLN